MPQRVPHAPLCSTRRKASYPTSHIMSTPTNLPHNDNQPCLFLLGTTGCGKSAIAVELAELLGNAEIVSADAYQVYRGMEIVTAAPTAQERRRVVHHLVGNLDPSENNDAATHARKALSCIAEIQARGKRAIVTGGSGLYVKFISHGISEAPPGDAHLRAELNALPLAELVRRLREVDPEGAAATDLHNPRYVARNLEIVLLGGKPLAAWKQNWQQSPAGPGFCITRETAQLDARIAQRTQQMLHSGALEEVLALGDLSRLSPTAAKTLGLSQIAAYLAARGDEALRARMQLCVPTPHGNTVTAGSLAELADAITLATRQYAKRQRTWLRRETWLSPVTVAADDSAQAVACRIAASLNS